MKCIAQKVSQNHNPQYQLSSAHLVEKSFMSHFRFSRQLAVLFQPVVSQLTVVIDIFLGAINHVVKERSGNRELKDTTTP